MTGEPYLRTAQDVHDAELAVPLRTDAYMLDQLKVLAVRHLNENYFSRHELVSWAVDRIERLVSLSCELQERTYAMSEEILDLTATVAHLSALLDGEQALDRGQP